MKITLEHKKLIAQKVMVWSLVNPKHSNSMYIIDNGSHLYLPKLDPTGIHFYDILDSLDDKIKDSIDEYIDSHTSAIKSTSTKISWVEQSKPEIINALIEVLENE